MRLIFFVLFFLSASESLIAQNHIFGKAQIINRSYYYEYNDGFSPLDFFSTNRCNLNPLQIEKKTPDLLIIDIHYGNCFTGYSFKIELDSSLNITNVDYRSSSDARIDGIRNVEEVNNIILYFNKNPFNETVGLIGRFHAIIKTKRIVDITIQGQFGGDTTYFNTRNWQFKVYSSEERKMSKDQLRTEMERKMGILDSNNVVEIPEFDPQFCFGSDSLTRYLQNVVFGLIDQQNIKDEKAYFEFTIDRAGRIEKVLVDTKSGLSSEIKKKIETEISKTSCWIPAINYGMTVKSTVYPWIKLKRE